MMKYKYFLITIGVIIIDQTVKLLVHFNMEMNSAGEIDVIGDWFKLHYLLNPGMAFGLRWDNEYGKLALTIFRLAAMTGIAYYLYSLINKGVAKGLLICMGLILGGAIGNVIDSTFYGILLDNAPEGSPTPWFHGQVIDMLFFPLFEGYFPEWIPWVGGDHFLFFSPVFNIADSSIFIGVVFIMIYQSKYFPKHEQQTSSELDDGENWTDSEAPETQENSIIATDEGPDAESEQKG